MPKLPQAERPNIDHIQRARKIIAGQIPIYEDDQGLPVFFRLPSEELVRSDASFGDIEAGQIFYTQHGPAIRSSGEDRAARDVGGPEAKLTVLAEIWDAMRVRRGELASKANKRITGKYSSPGGRTGHTLKEYDQLFEFFRSVKHRYLDQR